MNWNIDNTHLNRNRFKSYSKKHGRETASCIRNLREVLEALMSGIPFGMVKFGFLRTEGKGVYRVGQTCVIHAKETRLYFCIGSKTIYPLTIGGKETQQDDIAESHKMAARIQRGEE